MARGRTEVIDVRQFTGLNTLDDPVILDPSKSPYIENMDITQSGGVETRKGYELVTTISGEGGITGLLPYYNTYGSYKGDYLVICYDGNAYYITTSNTTATSIGSYGSDNGIVRGATMANVLVFGNGLAANTVKKWDGNTLSNLAGTPPDVKYFGVYAKRLYCAGNESATSTVYYSDTDTADTNLASNFILVNGGDGEDVTALVAEGNQMRVFKEDSIHALNFSFDSSYNITVPQQQPIVSNKGGAVAPGSVQSVYGYSYFLSKYGFQKFGSAESGADVNLPLPLSLEIQPTIEEINLADRELVSSAFYRDKFLCATPYGTSTQNDRIFVYDENVKRRFGQDAWTIYTGIYPSAFAVFRNAKRQDELYFASNVEPKIYKFNNAYSDNGFGYNRIWTSKTFQYGERTNWRFLDIEGSKARNAKIYVDIVTDGVEYASIIIDDSNFLQSGSGGYIGDNIVGEAYVGSSGTSTSSIPFFKFKKRIRIPDSVNYGYNMYFRIRNYNENEGWKMTRYRLVSVVDPDDPTYGYTD